MYHQSVWPKLINFYGDVSIFIAWTGTILIKEIVDVVSCMAIARIATFVWKQNSQGWDWNQAACTSCAVVS